MIKLLNNHTNTPRGVQLFWLSVVLKWGLVTNQVTKELCLSCAAAAPILGIKVSQKHL